MALSDVSRPLLPVAPVVVKAKGGQDAVYQKLFADELEEILHPQVPESPVKGSPPAAEEQRAFGAAGAV